MLCVAFLGVTLPVPAAAFDLSGAWATEAGLCDRVFMKKGGSVVFTELSDVFGSGFIIEGNRIRGRNARCTIKSRKESGDSVDLVADCATSIMNQSVRFNLKIIDDNNLTRLFPEIQGMTMKYTRCSI